MHKVVIFLTLLTLCGMVYSQERVSIHQQEYEKYSVLEKKPSFFDPSGKDIIPLNKSRSKAPTVRVFGYLPDWQYESARQNLEYDLLTHIAAFDFTVSPSGSVAYPSYWPWTDVINAAHQSGVKVVMTAVNFDADDIRTLLTDSDAKQNFFVNSRNIIKTYNLDGINVDFESLYSDDRGALLNGFMQDLTTYMHEEIPGSEVSFAGPAVNWGGWDLWGLSQSCDYIFIMGYAFYGSWSGTSGPCAPLTGGSYNITNTVLVQYGDVTSSAPERLILGVPYYGNRWQTEDQQPRSAKVDYIGSVRYHTAMNELENYTMLWESASLTPWYYYQTGQDWYQVWFDNDSSLGLKYQLAEDNTLSGVGMWALGYDGNRKELWDELRRRFAPGTVIPPPVPGNLYAHQGDNDDRIMIEFIVDDAAEGYWIYYGTSPQNQEDSVFTTGSPATISGLIPQTLYYFRIRAFNDGGASPISRLMAATTANDLSHILIVDGFDRTSGTNNNYDYIRQHAEAFDDLGKAISSAENEALTNGDMIAADQYQVIDWLLGDESTEDITFSKNEQQFVEHFLTGGGKLFVSGAEVGWDLVEKGDSEDQSFYRNFLKAEYLEDAPRGEKGTYYQANGIENTIFSDVSTFSYDDGSQGTYDVDWPDAIVAAAGSRLCLAFDGIPASEEGCGIQYEGVFAGGSQPGALVYLTIPFETIYPETSRIKLLQNIMSFFNGTSALADNNEQLPGQYSLLQNYPNPFNNSTSIPFVLPEAAEVRLSIYDARGLLILSKNLDVHSPGRHVWKWDGLNVRGQALSSGLYYCQISVVDGQRSYRRQIKMMMVK